MKSLTTLVTAAILYVGACEGDINVPTTTTNQELSVNSEQTEIEVNPLKGPSILRAGQIGYFTLVNKIGLIDYVPESQENTLDPYYRGDWLVSDGSKVEFLDDNDDNQNTFQIRFNSPGEYRVWNKYEEYFILVNVLEK